ncbi:MAG: ATP-grasp domain-containing protein [Gemmatimonadaceae bacterium]
MAHLAVPDHRVIQPRTELPLRITITDGNERASLAVVRSLGQAGHAVSVCASQPRPLAGASRYASAVWQLPDALTEPEAFATRLAERCEEADTEVLIPISEASLLAVLPWRDQFRAAIPFASASVFERVCDKFLVLKTAESLGLAVPHQIVIESKNQTLLLPADFTFPAVLKPARSVAISGNRIRSSVSYAKSYGEALAELDRTPDNAYPVLIQRLIEGPGMAISVLVWNGELRAAFSHRRITEKPPTGGVSVLCESIPLDRELLDRSLELLRQFEWQGVAMIEYKVDLATGTPFLMEINGRFWGSLQLAIDSGVDFPALLVEASMGKPLPPVSSYDVGTRLRWDWGNIDSLLTSLRQGGRYRGLPGAPGRLEAISRFLRSFGNNAHSEIMRRDDPRPFIRESIEWARRILP